MSLSVLFTQDKRRNECGMILADSIKGRYWLPIQFHHPRLLQSIRPPGSLHNNLLEWLLINVRELFDELLPVGLISNDDIGILQFCSFGFQSKAWKPLPALFENVDLSLNGINISSNSR
jgi:hypothetical protein